MSVSLLLAAVAATNNPYLAIVSSDLFLDLHIAAELDVTFHTAVIPSDPKYGKLIDALLRADNVDPNAPFRFPDYTLKKFPLVHVQQDFHWGLTLAPTGPGSFQVR